MGLFDTHCHLNDAEAFPEPGAAIKEAKAAGVDRLVVVGIDTEWSERAVEIAAEYEGIYAVVGWHPTSTARFRPAELDRIRELAAHPKVVAIGEIGLDYHWAYSTREQQFTALHAQLDLARELEMPMVFHCREAYPDLLDVLETRGPGPYLLHCFAGDVEDARRALALGCLFGVDGPVTYKKADPLRSVLREIGLQHLVIETDSPWMAPAPHRGKPNRPAWVRFVNDGLAAALGVTPEEVEAATSANAERFFRLT